METRSVDFRSEVLLYMEDPKGALGNSRLQLSGRDPTNHISLSKYRVQN